VMADDDLEIRLRDLERLASSLGNTVLSLQAKVARLESELSHELIARTIASLTPWPTRVVTVGALNSGRGRMPVRSFATQPQGTQRTAGCSAPHARACYGSGQSPAFG
jgi:hypothetical protein